MNRCPVYALVLLLGAGCLVAFGHPQKLTAASPGSGDTIHDAASFIAELHHLAVLLKRKPSTNEMAALRDTLPRHWTVSTPERIYLISSEPLRNQLTALSSERARVWVERLAAEIEGYSVAVPAGSSQARAELDRILARSEFAGVRPPSAWELFRQRIAAWVDRMLMKLFEGIGRHPIGGNILFWLLMIGGVVCIALWLFRLLASRDRFNALPPSDSVVASRTWQEWIRAAREAANAGDFREAVHSAYWAAIARLEDAGIVPKDRTKTPREYLRLMAEPAPGELAARPAHREPLAALTSRLERIWYANRGAGPDDFRESLHQVEALGCQLE